MLHTCFIIGKGALLIECAQVLRQNGITIHGIISDDAEVNNHCLETGLTCLPANGRFHEKLTEIPFDYLFSITNDVLLDESILSVARQQTINYHDSLLPAYAGVHATFWALVHGQTEHGITWHVVDSGIDTGPILIQRQFPIEPDETSISLNIKCYSAAIAAFSELVSALRLGPASGIPQNLSQRSYVGRKKRPNTLLDWQQPAAETIRLFRALDFGFHPNPFGQLIVKIGNAWCLVGELHEATVSANHPPYQPGTITSIDPGGLQVSTSQGLLQASKLTTLKGELVDLIELGNQGVLTVGKCLPQIEPSFIQTCHQLDMQCAPHQFYWQGKLGHLSLTRLSVYKPIHLVHPSTRKMDTLTLEIPDAVWNKWAQIHAEAEQTNDLLAAFLLTIARIENQASISVMYRSPASRQLASETADLYADCLPLTISIDWDGTAEKLVRTVSQELVSIDEHYSYAFDWLMTQPALHTVWQTIRSQDFPIVIHRSPEEPDQFADPNTLIAHISDGVGCQLMYNRSLWSVDQLNQLIQRWLIVLENLMSHPRQPLKTISLLTSQERDRILFEWNDTRIPYARHQLVHQLVEQQAQLYPQMVALRCGLVTLTYEQLNQRANQLARYLHKQGIVPNTLVGVCLERSADTVICLLAILKSGGAYVPLDPTYPVDRLQALQTQTNIRVILTQLKWLPKLATSEVPSIYIPLDQQPIPWATESVQNENVPGSAEQLAYVLFTSGSSGRPKSVAIPHRGIVRLIQHPNYMRLDPEVRMLGLAPLAFDASTLELWGSLATGGQLVLMEDSRPSLDRIKQTIHVHRINTIFLTTALFNLLTDSGIGELTSLTQLLTGGETASPEHIQRATQQLPHCRLIHVYGPTESTTFASFFTVPAFSLSTSLVPIGKPISNTQLYLVDPFLNLVPVGVPGELLIGGDGLAREYLFQPELTSERFITHQWEGQSAHRLYRTGDQGRYLPDGNIEFLGRLDDQVKIRGFRIEPGEIEFVLCQYSRVREALVVVTEPIPGSKALAAYVVVDNPQEASLPNDIRAFLQAKLPDYLLPKAIIVLSEMPLTPNGKVDKSRLPPAFPHRQSQPEQQLTPTEATIIPLWEASLNHPQSGLDDNFFDLGGSSIVAMRLLGQIYQQLGQVLSLKDIFEHPTIRQISAFIDQCQSAGEASRLVISPLTNELAENIDAPLSAAQNRLWIIHQLYRKTVGSTYNVPIILQITGPLKLSIFIQSIRELSQRHQILRTTFPHRDGIPYQRIAPEVNIPITECALENDGSGLMDWINQHADEPFDLEQGPLFRIHVAQKEPDSWVILLSFHHIIYDGWSTRVLAQELSQLYSSLVRQQLTPLPPLPVQYIDYTRWQQEQYTPETMQQATTYWKNRLADSCLLANLPLDYLRPPIQSFNGADYCFSLPDDHWQPFRYGLLEPGTTPFLGLLTAFAVWLGQTTHTNDFLIGIPVAGRNHPDLVSLIGFFVNTLALRIELSPTLSFRQLLRQVHRWTLDAYDHQALPFEQLVELLNPARSSAYNPVIQVLFDYQEDTTNEWDLAELSVIPIPFIQQTAKFDLHLSIRETQTGLEGVFNYRTDLFTHQTVVRMANDFKATLNQVISEPDIPLINLWAGSGSQPTILPQSTQLDVSHPIRQHTELVPPDPALVRLLQTIWSRLLQVPTVGLDDDFFDMGGHSLLIFQMITLLQQQRSLTLPVDSVFANPTIRQLAQYIHLTDHGLAWSALVSVQPLGKRPPLFLVHPISGEVGYVYQLSTYLSEDQPVYGLRAVGLDGIGSPLPSVEAMATHYIEQLLEQHPMGPYALGGYSMGGVIAFEMAQQLRRMGKEIILLALIDSYPMHPQAPTRLRLVQLFRYYHSVWLSLPKEPGPLWHIFYKKAPVWGNAFFRSLRHTLRSKTSEASNHQSQRPHNEPGNTRLIATSLTAYSRYIFKPYDGKIVFMRAAGKEGWVNSARPVSFGWKRYARKGVDVYTLASDHYSLFKDDVLIERIAHILSTYLRDEQP
ncbi:amino acid adenylation domain-containing protein [Spirosoma gilvum]